MSYPPGPFPPVVPEHPRTRLVLALGIASVALFGITAPFAICLGARTRREIDESGGKVGGRTLVTLGWILGWAGCASFFFAALALLAGAVFVYHVRL